MEPRTPFYRTFFGVWLLAILPIGTVLAVICRYGIDMSVVQWCWLRHRSVETADGFRYDYSEAARGFQTVTELFGDWVGACIVAVLILELDRLHRKRVVRYLASVCLASLIVGFIKSFVVRIRPYGLDFNDPELLQRQNVISFDWSSTFQHIEHSFPSGHTAAAFAAFVVLSRFYPQGRNVFFLLAVLTGVQRILCCAHFPSDVIFGAVVGLFAGGCCTAFSDLPKMFDRLENDSITPR